jgi:hypothetical protein
MGDWNLFFATAAGSAATLVGLLFIATQLHLGVFSNPKNRWAALGQSTLTILATAFVMSLSFLIPLLPTQGRGEIILVALAFASWRTIGIWWPFVVYVYMLTGAVGLLRGDTTALLTISFALLALFSIALRNAWRLVVNVEAEGS